MLLIDVQPYERDVSHLSISTKTYWWRQLLSNGGNLLVHLIRLSKIKINKGTKGNINREINYKLQIFVKIIPVLLAL